MTFQAADDNFIVLERPTEHVLRVVLARPERKNAISLAMWARLAAIFEAAGREDDTRVVLLTGAGGDFCAGADIGEFDVLRSDAASAARYEAANSRTFRAIRQCAVPTVAAISGICFGGGFGLAAACDLRIAASGALFAVPAARLGLAYPQDAMADIVAAAGLQMARYLTFTGARIDAREALAAGLVRELCDTEQEALQRAFQIAVAIAGNAPLSVAASKAAISATMDGDPAMVERARSIGARTFESADYAEGRAAFGERRRPVFRGC